MTIAQTKSANGKCPACRSRISFVRANFRRRGQPFACEACGEQLKAAKASLGLVIASFALALFLGKEFGFFAVLPVYMLLGLYEWLTVRVTICAHEQTVIGAKLHV
jgi:hypothetical protein